MKSTVSRESSFTNISAFGPHIPVPAYNSNATVFRKASHACFMPTERWNRISTLMPQFYTVAGLCILRAVRATVRRLQGAATTSMVLRFLTDFGRRRLQRSSGIVCRVNGIADGMLSSLS